MVNDRCCMLTFCISLLYFVLICFSDSLFVYWLWINPLAKKKFPTKCTWTFVVIFILFFIQQRQLAQCLGVFNVHFYSDIFRLLRQEENNYIWKIWINSLKKRIQQSQVWLLRCINVWNYRAVGVYLSHLVCANVYLILGELRTILQLSWKSCQAVLIKLNACLRKHIFCIVYSRDSKDVFYHYFLLRHLQHQTVHLCPG